MKDIGSEGQIQESAKDIEKGIHDLIELNEENYPMTYKEYEKRVVELFLESYEGETLELMKKRVEKELEDEPNCIDGCYGYNCFVYDHPEIYGETAKKTFEDNFLRQTPVAQLRMIIG